MKIEMVPHDHGRGLIKMWEPEGYPFEAEAMAQLRNLSKMPFVHKHVAAMPDAHMGKGACVGTVIATKGVIIPAAVGVDIGCGMMALRTNLTASMLPDSLSHIRGMIEAAVPHGRTDNGGKNDRGAWGETPKSFFDRWNYLSSGYAKLVEKHPKINHWAVDRHLGTLGTGNHFIELCLDEDQFVWVMLHSGSRGVGNKIGTYFIEAAKREMERYHIDRFLPDQDLSYLVEHTEVYDDYVEAVEWAQEYAMENRKAMMGAVLNVMHKVLPPFMVTEQAVNCHHNYVTREHHFGENVWVTRKGAVQARKGTLGIIPGSMGTGSFIVEGLGNADSFCSCSHGAGRVMSRTQAKKMITMEEHAKAMVGIEARLDADIIDESPAAYKPIGAVMVGIEARLDADIIDESPAAYKPIGAVMDAQSDLVEIKHRLRQVLNVKG
ncbi:RNA-splicing ligase [Sphingobium phage Lacusarx]|uniref:3'-phosphate/5'-hydroxy nucleic acid ligase n=1 Tax=Sphingobium phage Lacusarx TaxID=1980139 RepID=A0A1W6DX78_9CAUD|nr:tRNA splicing ligase [Sphingobium phage Lacusarx]ARK07489.1 RNA-splicing ligase [Sphingobium phage Lacusarx]